MIQVLSYVDCSIVIVPGQNPTHPAPGYWGVESVFSPVAISRRYLDARGLKCTLSLEVKVSALSIEQNIYSPSL